MRLGRHVHNTVRSRRPRRTLAGEDLLYELEVAYISADKLITSIAQRAVVGQDILKALEISSIRQGVEVDYVNAGLVTQHPPNEI